MKEKIIHGQIGAKTKVFLQNCIKQKTSLKFIQT